MKMTQKKLDLLRAAVEEIKSIPGSAARPSPRHGKKWNKLRAAADEIAHQYEIRTVYAIREAFWYRSLSLAPKPLKRKVERKIISLANHARELKALFHFCYPHIVDQLNTMVDGVSDSFRFVSTEFEGTDMFIEYLEAIGNLNAEVKTIRQIDKPLRDKFYSRLYAIYRQHHKNAKPKGLAFRKFVYACSQAVGEGVSYDTVEKYLMSACIDDYEKWRADIESDDPFDLAIRMVTRTDIK